MSLDQNPYAAPIGDFRPAPSGAAPTWFSVTPLKLVLMSLATFNLYLIYWHYKQWALLKAWRGDDIMPWARALFSIFFVNRLFDEVKMAGGSRGASLPAGVLAAGYILVLIVDRVAARVDLGVFGLVGLAAGFIVVPVQKEINAQLVEADPGADMNGRFGVANIIGMCIGFPILALAFVGTFLPGE
ncbi:hypothetical protein LBMAG42_38620 [Deltaproteobacteria bacterium]|nr:hypothetical protein LBMAG42_38620 [Deltaproteobacteria bacterium]